MKRLLQLLIGLLCLSLSVTVFADSAKQKDYWITFPDVQVREGVTCDVTVKVFVNENASAWGKDVFAIHGWCGSANCWKPFAEALFEKGWWWSKVRNFVAIDLPGHGASSLPKGEIVKEGKKAPMLYGDLTLDDYVRVIIEVLGRLPDVDLSPGTLFAHSQGGIVTQMLQKALINNGGNLATTFKIKKAFLLAPALCKAVHWSLLDNPDVVKAIMNTIKEDPALGTIVSPTDVEWLYFLLATKSSGGTQLAPLAPSPEQVAGNGWNMPEPIGAHMQLCQQPDIDTGIFGPNRGTELTMVRYEEDTSFTLDEEAQLYQHLTGDASGSSLIQINGPNTAHRCHVIIPEDIVEAIDFP